MLPSRQPLTDTLGLAHGGHARHLIRSLKHPTTSPSRLQQTARGTEQGLTSTRVMLASTHQRGTRHASAVYRTWKAACMPSTARGSSVLPQQSTPRHEPCARHMAQLHCVQ